MTERLASSKMGWWSCIICTGAARDLRGQGIAEQRQLVPLGRTDVRRQRVGIALPRQWSG
jgi:hypothetical protein